MGMNLSMFGVFAFGFLHYIVTSRVIYVFWGGIYYECAGDGGLLGFYWVSLGVSLRI